MREALGADPPGLLERLRAGDPRAFEELVIAYQHRVFGVALRMLGSRAEAEEIAQEVFLRAYRAIGEFRGEARLGTWLYGIASRLCLKRLASQDRRLVLVLRDVEGLSYEEIAETLAIDPGTVRSRLHRARLQLKEKLERFA